MKPSLLTSLETTDSALSLVGLSKLQLPGWTRKKPNTVVERRSAALVQASSQQQASGRPSWSLAEDDKALVMLSFFASVTGLEGPLGRRKSRGFPPLAPN